jgi:arylsulfatase A-like enzyme
MQGRSLMPLVRGQRVAWREDFFCENNFCVPTQYYPMIEGVRTGRWKYVVYTDVEPPREQLFDLDADANEVHDLVGEAAYASILADLRRRCRELRDESAGTPVGR